ncbi:MAG: glycosyltransferase, partial [bacterium]
PYGMVLLEAMSRGVACVCTTGCHIAADLERYGAAIVSGPDPKQLASAVAALLRRPDGVETQGRHGWEYARSVATIGGVVDRLEEIYKTVMPNRPVSA